MGLVRLTGPQRIWFLQQTITADIEDLPEGRWAESCFLDVKGKVVAHFRVGSLGEHVWIRVDDPGTDPLVDWFTRNRFRTKVDIEADPRQCETLLGEDAAALAADGELRAGPTFGWSLGVLRAADTFEPGLRGAPADELERLRIEAGIPRFGVDYGPDTLPQEAGLTRAISVTKGCYVGQEVMARLHFRGHANRTVRSLRFEGEAGAGAALLREGATVGTVTSVAGSYGIGMVRLVVAPGERIAVDGGATAVAGPVPEGTKTEATRSVRRAPD